MLRGHPCRPNLQPHGIWRHQLLPVGIYWSSKKQLKTSRPTALGLFLKVWHFVSPPIGGHLVIAATLIYHGLLALLWLTRLLSCYATTSRIVLARCRNPQSFIILALITCNCLRTLKQQPTQLFFVLRFRLVFYVGKHHWPRTSWVVSPLKLWNVVNKPGN